MHGANIHVIPNDSRDWVVKEEGTDRELGHYPSREDAEAVGLALARKRRSEMVVHQQGGKVHRRKARRGWFSRWFG
jgi:hypothetical protein